MLLPLVDRWAHESQLGSRRNAMVAATELTQRRIERQDVEAFLSSRGPAADVEVTTREADVAAAAR